MQNNKLNIINKIPLLDDNHIFIIVVQLDLDEDRVQLLANNLSTDETEKADRFHFEKHKRRYIAARGYLRQVLADQIGMNPKDIIFKYTKRGKPELSSNQNINRISFNLSHSHELAAIALSVNNSVGIDIELIKDEKDTLGLAKRYFSKKEYNLISSAHQKDQNKAFYRVWTRKEAYLKATGKGLAGIEDIEVTASGHEQPKILSINNDCVEAENWSLYNITTPDNYTASLAVKGHDFMINQFEIT